MHNSENVMIKKISGNMLANSLLQLNFKFEIANINHLKLQRLIYIAHGYHLAIHDKPLLNEKFKAWPYGPIHMDILNSFKEWGNDNIRNHAHEWINNKKIVEFIPENNEKIHDLIIYIKDKYGKLKIDELTSITNEKNGPWQIAYKERMHEIPNELIKTYFKNIL